MINFFLIRGLFRIAWNFFLQHDVRIHTNIFIYVTSELISSLQIETSI